MRALLVSTTTMRTLAELPMASLDCSDAVNSPGETTVRVSLQQAPELLPFTVPWRTQIAVTDDDYRPLWLGPVTKRRGTAVGGDYELRAQQWEHYLERVWLPDVYDASGLGDPAKIIADRIGQTRAFVGSFADVLPVPLPQNSPALTGRTVEFDFVSTFDGDRDWSGEPPTVLDDLSQVVQQGFVFAFEPRESAGVWSLNLTVKALPLVGGATVQIGLDAADVELFTDGESQTTAWWVVGDGDVQVAKDVRGRPLLMGSRSFDTVPSDATLQSLADALLAASAGEPLRADSVELAGVRRFTPGDLVNVDVPAGLYGTWPQGVSWPMRVESVSWRQDGPKQTTTLTLAQQLESVDPWAVPLADLPRLISDLRARLVRAETRRKP